MKSKKILELCVTPKSFSELKSFTGMSDSGLSKAISKFLERGLLNKKPDGKYITTEKGFKALGEEVKEELLDGIWVKYYNLPKEKVNRVLEELKGINEPFYLQVSKGRAVPDELALALMIMSFISNLWK
jgi:DNA-binding transcriptional ArsR family regulator